MFSWILTLKLLTLNNIIKIMDRWIGKVAVVTGASSGIGAAIAVDLANIGVKVVGLARRVERVESLKSQLKGKAELHAKKCDVSKDDEVKAAFKWIKEKFGGVDILVNNAGMGSYGDLVDPTKTEQYENVVKTNILAPIYCVREAFNSMKDRDVHGHIIILNSILGHSIPNAPFSLNIYAPTKYAVTAMTEVLRQEFERLHSKVKVTSLSPGVVDTEMAHDFIVSSPNTPALKAEDISDAVKYIISTPPRVKIHELTILP